MCGGVEASVPHGDDQLGIADGQGAGEVHRVGAAQGVVSSKFAGMLLDRGAEFNRPGGGPELVPFALGVVQLGLGEVVMRPAAANAARTSG